MALAGALIQRRLAASPKALIDKVVALTK